MLRSLVLAAAAIVSITSVATVAEARSNHRMAIYDANSGKKLFDDGKLDGRACAVAL